MSVALAETPLACLTGANTQVDHAEAMVKAGEGSTYFVNAAELAADPAMLAPPPFVVPRRSCAGRVTLLVGREKLSGKSTFLAYGAAKVSCGGHYLGEEVGEPSDVLVLDMDQHPTDALANLIRFGADLSRIRLCVQRPPAKDVIEVVHREIECFSPRLVIIDSLAKLAIGRVRDSNDPDDWEPLMTELVDIAREAGCAMEIAAHATKTTGEYRGSTGIAAPVDFILTLTAERRADATRKVTVEGRRKFADYEIRLDGERFSLVDDTVQSLEDAVCTYVCEHPGKSQNGVVKGVGGRSEEVIKVLRKLVDQKVLADRPTRRGWHGFYERGRGSPTM